MRIKQGLTGRIIIIISSLYVFYITYSLIATECTSSTRGSLDSITFIAVYALTAIGVAVFAFQYCVANGRTFYFHEEGCTVTLLFYRREYKWDDFVVKQYVNYGDKRDDTKGSVYISGVEFMPKRFKGSKRRKSATYCRSKHPFQLIWVYFLPKDERSLKIARTYNEIYYVVDEDQFREQMAKWNVRIAEAESPRSRF